MTSFRRVIVLWTVACVAIGPAALPLRAQAPETAAPPPMRGFGAAAAEEQRRLEARFDGLLDPAEQREWMRRLSARPHPVGSAYGKENAEFMADLFRSWGYETRIETFHVLFPTPKTRRLEMTAPTPFVATLAEPPFAEDPTSGQTAEQLPSYNAYSIDGVAEGELVYVNYGIPKDYEELARRGVDVRGKVVIARYGGSWRGIKPKVAAEHGAVGCIIYSDPRGDGYYQGDVWPRGGWRPEAGVQRGSVADMPLHAGDPLTPGVGATRDAKRLDRSQARILTRIPVLPISQADAEPLLRALGGPMAPEEWRGALPLPYHLGPGPARVRLEVAFDWPLVPAYDVIATLRGAEEPDRWIVRGNHHDAWVNGATDPVSGMVALLAEAKAVGELARSGWRPRRTIVYAAWDGEEPGLLGSVEWAETHAELLRERAVAYINTDSNGRGFLDVGGSHQLETLVNQAARDVVDPEKKVSAAERARAWVVLQGTEEERKEVRDSGLFRIAPLGSGSDYTPFLQHLGISALNLGYGGEDEYGQYHSIYDSFAHYTRFMDPDFSYGVALAQTAGRLTLRLAQAEVLPFEFGRFAAAVGRYVDEVAKLADDLRAEAEERRRRLDDRTYALYDDPTRTLQAPPPLDAVPHLNFAPLRNAATRLRDSADAYERALEKAGEPSPEVRERLNAILMRGERALTRREGLPGRPWFVHQVYAPGQYTGYGVKTLPAVREALELRRWREAEEQAAVVARTLEAFAAELDRARTALGPPAAS